MVLSKVHMMRKIEMKMKKRRKCHDHRVTIELRVMSIVRLFKRNLMIEHSF